MAKKKRRNAFRSEVRLLVRWSKRSTPRPDLAATLMGEARKIVADHPTSQCRSEGSDNDSMTIESSDGKVLSRLLASRLDVLPFEGIARIRVQEWLGDGGMSSFDISPMMYQPLETDVKQAIRTLKKGRQLEQLAAIRELGHCGAEGAKAIPHLLKIAEGKDSKLGKAAISSIRELGVDASNAVPRLVKLYKARSGAIRWTISAALVAIGPVALKAILKEVVEDPSIVRGRFTYNFSGFGRTCYAQVVPLLNHKNAKVRRLAVDCMNRSAKENVNDAMKHLVAALNDPVKANRNATHQDLKFANAAVPALRNAMRDKEVVGYPLVVDLLERLSPNDFKENHRRLLKQLQNTKGRVLVPGNIYRKLDLTLWNKLGTAERKKIAGRLTESIQDAGYELVDGCAHRFGPHGKYQQIAQWADRDGRRFVLIPGGNFKPGFSKAQIKKVSDILLKKYPEMKFDPKKSLHCDITKKPSQRIEPFIMMAEMYAENPDPNSSGRVHVSADGFELQQLVWLLEEKRWSIPSSHEFEWAVLGGVSTLYHWGDERGKFVRNEMANGERGELKWPWCNRFGLNSPLDSLTWCQPGKGKTPVISRGGAAWASPWQDCDEWLMFLTAASAHHPLINDLGFRFKAGVRPIIRFARGNSK